MNPLLAGVFKILATSGRLYDSVFECVMTLQYEGLDQQCEGNRDVVLKDDLQRRLKLTGWNGNNGNKKLSLTTT